MDNWASESTGNCLLAAAVRTTAVTAGSPAHTLDARDGFGCVGPGQVLSLALAKAGKSRLARISIIAITTGNSMSLKAQHSLQGSRQETVGELDGEAQKVSLAFMINLITSYLAHTVPEYFFLPAEWHLPFEVETLTEECRHRRSS